MQLIRISQLNISVRENADVSGDSVVAHQEKTREALLKKKAARALRLSPGNIGSLTIVRQGIDARRKPDILYVYTVDVTLKEDDAAVEKLVRRLSDPNVRIVKEEAFRFPEAASHALSDRPLVVGMGPAGLFAAYALAVHGHRPVVIERGRAAEERVRDVETFWAGGALQPSSNVQFGEGGAGTFSDGKLYTSLKDREGFFAEILKTFAAHGAAKEILYEAHPHIGTDRLVTILQSMRERMLALGADIRFETELTGLLTEDVPQGGAAEDGAAERLCRVTGIRTNRGEIAASRVILAIGHSARDTYRMLYEAGVRMEAKPFAAGFRIAHPQSVINEAMYGMAHPKQLPAAPYKLTYQTAAGRSVYSFCMCPGGYIINASSEDGRLCVNGMSYADRAGKYANSAVVVNVTPEDVRGFARSREGLAGPETEDVLAGIAFQRAIEEAACRAGGGSIPVTTFGAFRAEDALAAADIARSQDAAARQEAFRGQVSAAVLKGILPPEMEAAITEGILHWNRSIAGFAAEDALLAAAESRTSAPLRILRSAHDLQSVNVAGLYPCGEGAGYAGGIMSAAADGLRCARRAAT
ncbi:MAG: FAD-binding protein [Lachnospiraceae bacterium]|nr:FAD-binding protein [Lachnospiraceae bacterium]